MEIPLQAHVECADGRWGQSVYVLIDPVLAEVTSLVAREDSAAGTEYIVPLELVVATLDSTIKLSCSKAELAQLAPFVQTAFIPAPVTAPPVGPASRYGPGASFYLPYVTPEANALVPIEQLQIPKGELAIWRGTRVEATDGYVGKVDEFVVNPANSRITYLVMREEQQQHVIIPLAAMAEVRAGTVFLKLDKHQLKALPTFAIHQGW